MVIEVVDDQPTKMEMSPVNLVQTALTVQQEFGRRIVDAKSLSDPEQMELAIAQVCQDVLKYLGDWVAIGKRAIFGEGCMLSWADEYWAELGPLHAQYESFDELAKDLTHEEYSTYRAKIMVFRVFIENRWKIAKISEIGFQAFLDVPLGKMQKAAGKARKDEMDDGQWDALMDDNINDAQFRAIMGMTSEQRSQNEKDFVEKGDNRFALVAGGELVYYRPKDAADGNVANDTASVTFGKLFTASKDEDVQAAVSAFIGKMQVKKIT